VISPRTLKRALDELGPRANIHSLRKALNLPAHRTREIEEALQRLQPPSPRDTPAQSRFHSRNRSEPRPAPSGKASAPRPHAAHPPRKGPASSASPQASRPAPGKERHAKPRPARKPHSPPHAAHPAHAPRSQAKSRPAPPARSKSKHAPAPAAPLHSPASAAPAASGTSLGRLRVTRRGEATFIPDDPALPPLTIGPAHLSGALHGDRVEVQALGEPGTGRVIEIAQAARRTVVGTFTPGPHGDRVIPDDGRLPGEVHVTGQAHRVHPTPGDKVVVQLDPGDGTGLRGVVIEVLGPPDASGVDMLAIIRRYELPEQFPGPVQDEAEQAPDRVLPEDLAGRRDCRADLVVTIDPDDARDFDDAFFLAHQRDGTWRLWVHIADVSHYVRAGSALDEEASVRGNSTYLVDRVIPMLPEALSNEICSLKPHVDRLTKCVEFVLAPDGQVRHAEFYPAVIHSKRRHSYQDAFALIDGKRPPRDEIDHMLLNAHTLAQRIRARRMANGSLDLDFPERKIRLDAAGRVNRVEIMENDASHQLIEEFMLLANEAVAAELVRRSAPAVHRIHEPPDPERLEEFGQECRAQRIPCGDLTVRAEVVKLLKRLKTHPSGPALRIGLLRSLKRARYSPEPLGHYGLAKTRYTHFTSPIRRYADLLVHRAVFGIHDTRLSSRSLAQTADHISQTERVSGDAEQDSKQVKLLAFLSSQLETRKRARYGATITEMRRFGFFVDVDSLGLRGLVSLRDCADDFYQWNPATHTFTGRRHRRVLRLGDKIEVLVCRVNPERMLIDFVLA
jgi:ribonuclease R